jgi:TrmH family RNA methyltransferase
MATIIRTCICFGIDGIILTKNSVDLFSPKILRDSSGASANINYITYNSAFEALENIKQNGYEIYATCLDETSVDIETVDFNKDIVFVLGNEGNGLDLDFANKCDKKVIIKQKSFDSLNVAVCGAIITYLWSKK